MVGVKNKWNDMVECGGIVVASEQWLRLVMYEGRRTEAQKDIVVVVILSRVTLDAFQPFGLHQEDAWFRRLARTPLRHNRIIYRTL